MNKAELEKRFSTLGEHARTSIDDIDSFLDSEESLSRLSPRKKEAWQKLLSSVATIEAIEDQVIRPISRYFAANPPVNSYLKTHAKDEFYHAELLRVYTKRVFGYEKTKRSMTDRLVYDRFLPFLAKKADQRPIPFAISVLFYEKYAFYFYDQLKRSAQNDGLLGLVRLLEAVEKDERRHLSGIEGIFHYLRLEKKVDWMDRLATRALLQLLLADIDQSPYAFYNHHVRSHLLILGVDVDFIVKKGKASASAVLSFMETA